MIDEKRQPKSIKARDFDASYCNELSGKAVKKADMTGDINIVNETLG